MSVARLPILEARAEVADRVAASGSTFYWAMRMLPAARRRGMYAIYAFCREVDDIADGDAPEADKLAALEAWREAIGGEPGRLATRSVWRALAEAIAEHGLPRCELRAVLDGVEMDARRRIVAPPAAELELYCRRVAGAVGVLSLHIFGRTDAAAKAFGLDLGRSLQLTNILRDLEEDAERGRLYIPRDDLEASEVRLQRPAELLRDPAFARVFECALRRARAAFARTEAQWQAIDHRGLRAAGTMMSRYRALLGRIERLGWPRDPEALRFGRWAKAGLVLRSLVAPGS